ncbi:MAG: tetratricopeptide repeat protein [Deltaproteobacteria bacterium]|nr:tetratricopeptide repeat protein [Deltaproteobacteria bacterium]MBW2074218.1 tetratricopeptide repeat protein [Deltaproteobacteria bacterium]
MKSVIKVCLGIFLVVAFCSPLVFAESKVVTCQGKYVMGDLDTKKEAKALALMEAKRAALEQAGTYLESSSEVKNYELTKDEISSLASGVMSVEVLKEEWKMSGENLMVTVLIRATVDTSNLKARIAALKDNQESVEELKNIQAQLAALQEELHALKAQRTEEISGKQRETPKREIKEKYVAITNTMTALDHLKSAEAAMANGRLEEALSYYNQALSVDPNMAEAYAGQAIVLKRMGKPHKALKKIDKALELAPSSARAHSIKSLILAESHRYTLALNSINKAIELNPKNPRFYFGRGMINLKSKRPRLALKDFERACRMGAPKACKQAKTIAQRLNTQKNSHQRPIPFRRPPVHK